MPPPPSLTTVQSVSTRNRSENAEYTPAFTERTAYRYSRPPASAPDTRDVPGTGTVAFRVAAGSTRNSWTSVASTPTAHTHDAVDCRVEALTVTATFVGIGTPVPVPPPVPPAPGSGGFGNPPPPPASSSLTITSLRVRVTICTGSDPASGIDTWSSSCVARVDPITDSTTSSGSKAGFGTDSSDRAAGRPL